ncbi:MAG: AMP-binding protein [Pseudomonadales bacterium]
MSSTLTSYTHPIDRLHWLNANMPDESWLHEQIDGEWVTLNCKEAINRALRIGNALRSLGLEPGDKVAILAKNSPQWMISDFALMMAGMISVPIYTTAGEKTISYVLEHSGAKAVFVGKLEGTAAAEATLRDIKVIAYPETNVSSEVIDHQWNELLAADPLEDIASPNISEMATLVYTSGSTGNPKGVVLSFENLAAAAQGVIEAQPAKEKHRVLSYLPMAHITERSLVSIVSLYELGDIYFSGGLDTFMGDLQHAKPTNFISVPRLWAKFQAQVLAVIPDHDLQALLASDQGEEIAAGIREKLGLQHAKQYASGSAPIPPGLLTWFHGIGMPISEGWGMTETSGASCTNMPFNPDHLGTLGTPLSCVEMSLSNEQEILIRGPAIFKKYYNNPEATAEAFVDGWFRTGDKAELRDDGAYRIIGRVKEQFKTAKGKYVAPVPIESLLGALPYVEQVCVLGIGRAQPMAIVVPIAQEGQTPEQLVERMEADMNTTNENLEPHCKLNCIILSAEPMSIDNGMLTPTLKLKRDVIEAHFAECLGDENKGVIWQTA